MSVTICHASIDENGKITGGAAGDQTGKEVCTRAWYGKGWNVMLRYSDRSVAQQAAAIAKKLADSNLVGYDQNGRNTLYAQLKKNDFNVDKYIESKVKTETDCSAFVYACYCCVLKALRSDSNAPTTRTMREKYKANGFTVNTNSSYLDTDANLLIGDVLVKEGSHTVMAISNGTNTAPKAPVVTPPTDGKYYPKYNGTSVSIIEALAAVGEKDTSLAYRKQIAIANGISDYSGTAVQNSNMVKALKAGTLLRAGQTPAVPIPAPTTPKVEYYPKYTGNAGIMDALNSLNADGSLAHRKLIAAANNIANYKGTAAQNTQMLNLLKQGKLIKA